jgi:hypothetical protein
MRKKQEREREREECRNEETVATKIMMRKKEVQGC